MDHSIEDKDLFSNHGIYFLKERLSPSNEVSGHLFHDFYSVDQTLWSLRSDFFPYSLHQFLSFCNDSLNHLFAGGYIFHQPDGLAHGQNSRF